MLKLASSITFFIIFISLYGCATKTANIPFNNGSPVETTSYSFFSRYSVHEVNALKNIIHKNKDNFYSLSRNDVLNLLGDPIEIKNTKSILIWQYRENDCSLNIIWQKNKDDGDSIEIGDSKFTANNNSQYDDSDKDNNIVLKDKDNYRIVYLYAINLKKQQISPASCLIKSI